MKWNFNEAPSNVSRFLTWLFKIGWSHCHPRKWLRNVTNDDNDGHFFFRINLVSMSGNLPHFRSFISHTKKNRIGIYWLRIIIRAFEHRHPPLLILFAFVDMLWHSRIFALVRKRNFIGFNIKCCDLILIMNVSVNCPLLRRNGHPRDWNGVTFYVYVEGTLC